MAPPARPIKSIKSYFEQPVRRSSRIASRENSVSPESGRTTSIADIKLIPSRVCPLTPLLESERSSIAEEEKLPFPNLDSLADSSPAPSGEKLLHISPIINIIESVPNQLTPEGQCPLSQAPAPKHQASRRSSLSPGKHVCCFCERPFRQKKNLDKHMDMHRIDEPDKDDSVIEIPSSPETPVSPVHELIRELRAESEQRQEQRYWGPPSSPPPFLPDPGVSLSAQPYVLITRLSETEILSRMQGATERETAPKSPRQEGVHDEDRSRISSPALSGRSSVGPCGIDSLSYSDISNSSDDPEYVQDEDHPPANDDPAPHRRNPAVLPPSQDDFLEVIRNEPTPEANNISARVKPHAAARNKLKKPKPTPILPPGDQIDHAPVDRVRTETYLHVSLPMTRVLSCTEDGCHAVFSADNWYTTVNSLKRHLRVLHRLPIQNTRCWCTLCGAPTGRRAAQHHCLVGMDLLRADDERQLFPCAVEGCDSKFPSNRALSNHKIWHRKSAIRDSRPTVNLPPKTPIGPRSRAAAASRPSSGPPPLPDDQGEVPTMPPRSGLKTKRMTRAGSIEEIPRPTISSNNNVQHPPEDPRIPTPPPVNNTILSDTTYLSSQQSDHLSQDVAINDDDLTPSTDIPPPTSSFDEPDPMPLDPFRTPLTEITGKPVSPETWGDFEEIMAKITGRIAEEVKLPTHSSSTAAFVPTPLDVGNHRTIQRLYNRNRRRAIRLIVEGSSQQCPIPAEPIEEHFTSVFTDRSFDRSIFDEVQLPPHPEMDTSPFTPSEVKSRLHRFENSAPGPDRISYRHLKTVDPDCRILTQVLNICLMYGRIPDAWKKSRSILIFKKGDPTDIGNWRPISLCCSMYKLYTGCLASRLTAWITSYNILSPCQKGFMPFDGVFEHQYILKTRLQRARRPGGNLCIGQIDLTNAFGSIPHGAISEALRSAGAGSQFIQAVESLYLNSSTEFISGTGITEEIEINAGVRQGCPISGILFNIVIDPIIRILQGESEKHHVLAFADDVLLLEESPEGLQSQLDHLAELCDRLNLQVNPSKCCSMHLSGVCNEGEFVGTRATTFNIGGVQVKALADGEETTFLGAPVGFSLSTPMRDVKDILELGEKIGKSALAPWQRIDALKTFFYPCLNFAMRSQKFPKAVYNQIDAFMAPLLKLTLSLPENASNDYLYGSSGMGLIGIPKLADEHDVTLIDNAYKLLTSRDEGIRSLAWDDLLHQIGSRYGLDCPSPQDVERFLGGVMDEEALRTSNLYASTWTAARSGTRRFSTRCPLAWRCREIGEIDLVLEVPSPDPEVSAKVTTLTAADRRAVCRTLKAATKDIAAQNLINRPSQGVAIECVAAHKVSSHFIRSGFNTKFADWRFVHRARLNLHKLNGSRSWEDAGDKTCRRCRCPNESLLHVVSSCLPSHHLRTRRHDAILSRLERARTRRWKVFSKNQVVHPTSNLRPDLILTSEDNRRALVLDVAVVFENRLQAFERARREKEEKYKSLADDLKSILGVGEIRVEALIIGALGSWDPKNERVLRQFTNKRYLNKFRKYCCSTALRHSRCIFQQHIHGKAPREGDTRMDESSED